MNKANVGREQLLAALQNWLSFVDKGFPSGLIPLDRSLKVRELNDFVFSLDDGDAPCSNSVIAVWLTGNDEFPLLKYGVICYTNAKGDSAYAAYRMIVKKDGWVDGDHPATKWCEWSESKNAWLMLPY